MTRVVFMGTPAFAVPSLQALLAMPGLEVVLVVSQPDRPVGRGQKLHSPPVIQCAREADLPTLQPDTLRSPEVEARLADTPCDLMVVAAYGEILRPRILALPRVAPVNVHASLLPRWRGAAPIQWAVAAGDACAGVSIMQMEKGLDTGGVWDMAATMVRRAETAGELHDRLAGLAAPLLARALPRILAGEAPEPQVAEHVCWARMLRREDRALPEADARTTACWVNGMSPWPGVTVLVDGERLSLLRAWWDDDHAPVLEAGTFAVRGTRLFLGCARGPAMEVLEAQRAGRRPMRAQALTQGWALDGRQALPVPP